VGVLFSVCELVEKSKRPNVCTDFLDMMGEEREIELPGFSAGLDIERFRDKTHQFLKAHESDPVIYKLRWNEPLNKEDLNRLEKMLAGAGTAMPGELQKIRYHGELGFVCAFDRRPGSAGC
jgi:type I site-specific restriction endonuclease